MTITERQWQEYLDWNLAIAEVVYSEKQAGLPTYLDLEEETLAAIRDLADESCVEPSEGLQQAVLSVLILGQGPTSVFNKILTELHWWSTRGQLDEPPTLALLAVLSLAAENMHAGEGKASHNFYGRLADLLVLSDDEKEEFTRAYRRIHADGVPTSETLWNSLSSWLEQREGNRGLPTAYALGHAHIGPPLSQALVRETDRKRLHDAFSHAGLGPRSIIDAVEMRILIEEWMSRVPCPASNSFASLWRNDGTARERIIDVARIELTTWDGVVSDYGDSGLTRPNRLRLIASLRTFITKEVNLSLGLPAAVEHLEEQFELLNVDGSSIGNVDFVARTAGWLLSSPTASIEPLSILLGDVYLRSLDGEGTAIRRPRRLIPLRFDGLLQAFVEQERVSLGEEHLILAHPDLVALVDPVIAEVARPGFNRLTGITGLPSGWLLYEHVQILSSISPELVQHLDLRVLQPLARTQVVLDGGLKIPGNIPKWSTHYAPELRVTSGDSGAIKAQMRSIRALAEPAAETRQNASQQPVLVWPLQGENLPDGDYEIKVFSDGAQLGSPLTLRLRTADNPAIRISNEAVAMLHRDTDELFGFSAKQVIKESGFQVAPPGHMLPEATRPMEDQFPPWWVNRHLPAADRPTPFLQAPQADSQSCIFTGAHLFALDQAVVGQSTVEGVCKYCGLVKRHPAWRGKQKRSSGITAKQPPKINVRELEPVADSIRVTWANGYDAVCHMGEGPVSALRSVAEQTGSDQLFGDAFIRRLEGLGHIEIERSAFDLSPKRWAVADPTFIELSDSRWCLTGFRNDTLLAAVEDFAYEHGLEFTSNDRIAAPPAVTLQPLGESHLSQLLDLVSKKTGRPSRAVVHAAAGLIEAMPPLSTLLNRLPKIPLPRGKNIEKWNPTVARFEEVVDAHSPGAYRVSSFGRRYFYREVGDSVSTQATLGDARLVKYAVALHTNQTLVGYDPQQYVLFVPLGADLPGLYGRAAVLSTGSPPVENLEQRALEYRGIPPSLAEALITKLMS